MTGTVTKWELWTLTNTTVIATKWRLEKRMSNKNGILSYWTILHVSLRLKTTYCDISSACPSWSTGPSFKLGDDKSIVLYWLWMTCFYCRETSSKIVKPKGNSHKSSVIPFMLIIVWKFDWRVIKRTSLLQSLLFFTSGRCQRRSKEQQEAFREFCFADLTQSKSAL